MTPAELLSFMREYPLAVQASVSPSGSAQAALVGIVVTNEFEVFFDTMAESRKVANLRHDSRIAFVIGGTALGDERTLQYEGIADEPTGADLRRLKGVYFERFPDGRDRQSWPARLCSRPDCGVWPDNAIWAFAGTFTGATGLEPDDLRRDRPVQLNRYSRLRPGITV
jgi:Pyridoxamine 5'-phosphate oxidase